MAPTGVRTASPPPRASPSRTPAFSNSQRLLNIYDGPTFEDSDAFADIHTLKIGTVKNCRLPGDNVGNPGVCNNLGWDECLQQRSAPVPGRQ